MEVENVAQLVSVTLVDLDVVGMGGQAVGGEDLQEKRREQTIDIDQSEMIRALPGVVP